jgi:hypothetical protein
MTTAREVTRWCSGQRECAVVIAVAVVLMMQMAIYEVVDMITVWNSFVTAVRSVHVRGVVAGAGVSTGACGGVVAADVEVMLRHDAVRLMMQVPVVQVVDVIAVSDGVVSTVGAVDVRMIGVNAHGEVSSERGRSEGGDTVLASVRENGDEELQDVGVLQRVEHVLAVATGLHESLGAEHAQPLRNDGQAIPRGVGEFGDAARSGGEFGEQADTGRVPHGAQDARGAVGGAGGGGQHRRGRTGVISGGAGRGERADAGRHALNVSSLA